MIAGIGTEATKRTVSLVLDGKVLESKSVDIAANGRASVEFLSLESPYGFHKGEIRIEPGDSLHEDDRFPFAVERTDPHPVLFLHAAGQQHGELYYRAALESVPEAGFVLEPLAVEQATNQSLSKYAFVVLSDVGALPPGLENSLRAYVNGGGSLLVALGRDVGGATRRAGVERGDFRDQLRRTRRRPIPDGGERRCRASLACAAPTSWMACSSIRWCAWNPASRA